MQYFFFNFDTSCESKYTPIESKCCIFFNLSLILFYLDNKFIYYAPARFSYQCLRQIYFQYDSDGFNTGLVKQVTAQSAS